ncbi:GNAT family N-acetyltransferase [Marinomonas sp. 2405UD66-6]|uniref:GNAT family N-acetyltransferase n=1 Tax=Marinomonas sp. 2405UD66-6 TaxID=3391834 RepID=UPI0039C8F4D7
MKKTYSDAELVPSLWFPLVKKFYQEHYPSGKPNKADPIWVIRDNNKIVCSLRLKQLDQVQLLTAMVTEPSYRNKGLGGHLIQCLHGELSKQASYCFALTPLVPFYTRNGFARILPEELPAALLGRFKAYQAQGRKITPMFYKQPNL